MPRLLATAIATSLLASSPFAGEPVTAALRGSVQDARSGAPLAGVTVRLRATTGEIDLACGPTDRLGRFAVTGVPGNAYHVAVQAGDRLYLVDGTVAVAPGSERTIRLDVRPGPALAPAGVWDDPTLASVVVAGSAIVLGLLLAEATKDDGEDEQTASPSIP